MANRPDRVLPEEAIPDKTTHADERDLHDVHADRAEVPPLHVREFPTRPDALQDQERNAEQTDQRDGQRLFENGCGNGELQLRGLTWGLKSA